MQRTNCLKQTNKQQQRIKTVLSTYAVAQKKIPQKMSLIRVRTQTSALPVRGSNHWASKPTASWSFFIFIFVLEAFFLLLLSCVFNCDHFLCIFAFTFGLNIWNSSIHHFKFHRGSCSSPLPNTIRLCLLHWARHFLFRSVQTYYVFLFFLSRTSNHLQGTVNAPDWRLWRSIFVKWRRNTHYQDKYLCQNPRYCMAMWRGLHIK